MTELKDEYKLDMVSVRLRLVEDQPLYADFPIVNSDDAVDLFGRTILEFDREVIGVINMDAKGKVMNASFCSVGTLSSSLTHPRELLKSSILSNASHMIMIHNHPSGNVHPSIEDVVLTDRMIKVCDLVGIPLVDHIIVGEKNGYMQKFSMNANSPERFKQQKISYETELEKLDFSGATVIADEKKKKSKSR